MSRGKKDKSSANNFAEERTDDNSSTSSGERTDKPSSRRKSASRHDKPKRKDDNSSDMTSDNSESGGLNFSRETNLTKTNYSPALNEIPVISEANQESLATSLAREKDGYASDKSDNSTSTTGTQDHQNADDESDDPTKDDELGDNQDWRRLGSAKERRINPLGWIKQQCARLMLRRDSNSISIERKEAWSIMGDRYPSELALALECQKTKRLEDQNHKLTVDNVKLQEQLCEAKANANTVMTNRTPVDKEDARLQPASYQSSSSSSAGKTPRPNMTKELANSTPSGDNSSEYDDGKMDDNDDNSSMHTSRSK
jgi:hypothetical protein